MKRLLALFVALGIAGAVYAYDPADGNPFVGPNSHTFSVTITDDNITGVAALVKEDGATFTQMAASGEQKVRVVNNSTDSVKVHVTGLDSANQRYIHESMLIAGGGGIDTTATIWYAIEHFWVDKEGDGTTVLQEVDTSVINTISAGDIHESPALVLFGDRDRPMIESISFAAITNDTLTFELRQYDDVADVFDLGDGYAVRAKAAVSIGSPTTIVFPNGLSVSPHGLIAVFSTSTTNAATGTVTVNGRRKR